jgi:hypothetical protein
MDTNKEFDRIEKRLRKEYRKNKLNEQDKIEIQKIRNLFERTAAEFTKQLQLKFMAMELAYLRTKIKSSVVDRIYKIFKPYK